MHVFCNSLYAHVAIVKKRLNMLRTSHENPQILRLIDREQVPLDELRKSTPTKVPPRRVARCLYSKSDGAMLHPAICLDPTG
jgi:hypothetical protein